MNSRFFSRQIISPLKFLIRIAKFFHVQVDDLLLGGFDISPIRNRLILARLLSGITFQSVSERIPFSKQYIAYVESGEYPPSYKYIWALADAAGLSTSSFAF